MAQMEKKRAEDSDLKEALISAFEQSNEWARAFMDLRFKHFTTFMVITALLGTLTFQISTMSNNKRIPAIGACILTLLFWALDLRTSQYQRFELAKLRELSTQLSLPKSTTTLKPAVIKASTATNLIFLVILGFWLSLVIGEFKNTTSSRSPASSASPARRPSASAPR